VIRLLADENVPSASVRKLREAGWDVAELERGASDAAALVRAGAEQRVIVTFDRDFGRLALRPDLPRPSGVVLFRTVPANPEAAANALLSLPEAIPLSGRLTVIREGRVRQRLLARGD
jgi:predicted nuclease of predicted toxin-antitoxin system